MKARTNKRESGFTLIELGVVVAVIAILATVVLVGRGFVNSARVSKVTEAIHNIQTGVHQVLINGNIPPGGVNNAFLIARSLATANTFAPATGYTLTLAGAAGATTFTVAFTCPTAQVCQDISAIIATDPNVTGVAANTATFQVGD